MRTQTKAPTAIDVFSGMGGLTLGLKRAGFRVVAGIEVNKEIAKTYEKNHPEVVLVKEDIRNVHGKDILARVGMNRVDLVAGCPPCQGFSKLTDKYHREDPRNDLILEMLRLIRELNPRMVMMENVAGLATRGKSRLDAFVKGLELLGFVVRKDVLQLANYGVPQSRRRLVLLAGKDFAIELPKQTHSLKGDEKKRLKRCVRLGRVIKDVGKPLTLSKAMEEGGPIRHRWHVVRNLEDVSRDRIRALRPGQNRKALPKSLRPECHEDTNYGYTSSYGRLSWNEVAPTITTGCTSPCKGKFGHPSQIRALSIREAASIQTFPLSYSIMAKDMETAGELVGNALPPKFARIAARQCIEALASSRGRR
jgi:DNA (cytosine-5)-methyltransferase 1